MADDTGATLHDPVTPSLSGLAYGPSTHRYSAPPPAQVRAPSFPAAPAAPAAVAERAPSRASFHPPRDPYPYPQAGSYPYPPAGSYPPPPAPSMPPLAGSFVPPNVAAELAPRPGHAAPSFVPATLPGRAGPVALLLYAAPVAFALLCVIALALS